MFIFSNIRYPVPHLFRFTRQIVEVIRKYDPDVIVYSHMIYLTTLPCLVSRLWTKKPVVMITDVFPGINWSFGSKVVNAVGYVYMKTLGRLFMSSADAVHFLSSDLSDYVDEVDVDPEKTFVVTRGVDTKKFCPANRKIVLKDSLGIRDGEIVVLNVGRLDLVKGVNYLLEAAKKITEEYDNVRFVIVGDGYFMDEYKKYCEPFKDRVVFTGFRDDVPDIMKLADIFMLPSLSEGAANAVMEASSSGLPVIASAVGEIPRIIEDGKTGFLVQPRDSNAIADRLRTLITDEKLRQEMGQRGRERMIALYDWEIIGRNTERSYGHVKPRDTGYQYTMSFGQMAAFFGECAYYLLPGKRPRKGI